MSSLSPRLSSREARTILKKLTGQDVLAFSSRGLLFALVAAGQWCRAGVLLVDRGVGAADDDCREEFLGGHGISPKKWHFDKVWCAFVSSLLEAREEEAMFKLKL